MAPVVPGFGTRKVVIDACKSCSGNVVLLVLADSPLLIGRVVTAVHDDKLRVTQVRGERFCINQRRPGHAVPYHSARREFGFTVASSEWLSIQPGSTISPASRVASVRSSPSETPSRFPIPSRRSTQPPPAASRKMNRESRPFVRRFVTNCWNAFPVGSFRQV